jgi:hypothetical protein
MLPGRHDPQSFSMRHCERSNAIHLKDCRQMDCLVAPLLAMTK